MIQMFVPPQRVPSGDYFVWNTELVASSRVIAIGIVVEAGGDLADRVPINPDVCVFTAAGELAVPLRAGSEGPIAATFSSSGRRRGNPSRVTTY
jgi:hypothetical protein